MIARIGQTLLATLGLMSIASTALAQGNTFNPYGNSGYADYREFGNAMVSNNPALPGQALLNNRALVGRPRPNSFQDYANELEGSESGSPAARRAVTSNLPYYQAYQLMNSDYDRVYRPNNTEADRKFYERQRLREENYAKAMKEPDPAKRAKLLRQVEQDTLDRPAVPSRSAATKGATATKPGANGSAPPPRSVAPTERRQPAPPPFAVDTTRRPGSTGSATRAPAPPPGRSTAPPPPNSRTGAPRSRPAPPPDTSTIPVPPPR